MYSLAIRDNRNELRRNNELVAYIQDEVLFCIDKRGTAHDGGPIDHPRQMIGKYELWKANHIGA